MKIQSASSVAQSYLILCNPMDCSRPGFPVHNKLPELVRIHAHQVGDVIQPSHPLSSSSPPDFNLSQHQGLFKLIGSLHQVAKVLEIHLHHESFQWILRSDFFIYFFKFYFIFKIYNIVLVLPNIEMNLPQVYMCSPSWTLLPPPSPYHPLGRPSAPAPSIQYRASNLDRRLVSYMILCVFQCHSPKSSHPLPLPQSPNDCSIYLCLFCCLTYRGIVTIFLNSIYMH